MVHWAWLVVAFACGGAASLVLFLSYLTQGFSTTSLKLWKAAFELAMDRQTEVEMRAGIRHPGDI